MSKMQKKYWFETSNDKTKCLIMLQVLLLDFAMDDVIETLVVYHCSMFLILFPCCIHVHIQGAYRYTYIFCVCC